MKTFKLFFGLSCLICTILIFSCKTDDNINGDNTSSEESNEYKIFNEQAENIFTKGNWPEALSGQTIFEGNPFLFGLGKSSLSWTEHDSGKTYNQTFEQEKQKYAYFYLDLSEIETTDHYVIPLYHEDTDQARYLLLISFYFSGGSLLDCVVSVTDNQFNFLFYSVSTGAGGQFFVYDNQMIKGIVTLAQGENGNYYPTSIEFWEDLVITKDKNIISIKKNSFINTD